MIPVRNRGRKHYMLIKVEVTTHNKIGCGVLSSASYF